MGATAWIQAVKNINTADKSSSLILFQTTVGLDLSLFSRIDFPYVSFETPSHNSFDSSNFFFFFFKLKDCFQPFKLLEDSRAPLPISLLNETKSLI